MDVKELGSAMAAVRDAMAANKAYLVELDQQNGDGDLGITMSEGYSAVAAYLAGTEETDLGKALMKCSGAFNEAAPSTLGTITSFAFMGMARALKGKTEAGLAEWADALDAGLALVMEKAKSGPGQKTILDAALPAARALREGAPEGRALALAAAAEAARRGSESTRQMRSVHGRAAYYGDKSIGVLDGGSAAGRIIFESLAAWAAAKD